MEIPGRGGNLLEIVSVQRDVGGELLTMPWRCAACTNDGSKRQVMKKMPEKKSYGRSKSGVELTPEVLERMSKEAEAGLDVAKLRPRPGRPAMGSGPADALPVRLDPELRRAVDQRAAAENTTSSEVVRKALRRYLKTG